MPELPEVEATRLNLARWTLGATISAVRSHPPSAAPDASATLEPLVGHRIIAWHRHGKRLAASLSNAAILLVQLGMTGRIVRDAPPDRPYQRVIVSLDTTGPSSRTSRFSLIDLRRLGRVTLVPSLADAFDTLGPDALTSPLDGPALRRAVGLRRAPIKSVLMDQALIAGLGNIAVIEACFRAELHPLRPADSLTDDDHVRLAAAITAHLVDTLATTVGHDEIAYVSEGGDNPFQIYGRQHEACRVCDHPIQRILQGGRPVFWCASCQPPDATRKSLDNQTSRSSRQP